jgi:hypothetical protein
VCGFSFLRYEMSRYRLGSGKKKGKTKKTEKAIRNTATPQHRNTVILSTFVSTAEQGMESIIGFPEKLLKVFRR